MRKYVFMCFLVSCFFMLGITHVNAAFEHIEITPDAYGSIQYDSQSSATKLIMGETISAEYSGKMLGQSGRIRSTFQRAYVEFTIPNISGNIVGAQLILQEQRDEAIENGQVVKHLANFYTEVNSVINLGDLNPTSIISTTDFEIDQSEDPDTVQVDIEEFAQNFNGKKLGVEIMLAGDFNLTLGSIGSVFLSSETTPIILVTIETDDPEPDPEPEPQPEPEPEPDPDETPTIPLDSVIITDDLSTNIDLSLNVDVDAEGEEELALKWNFDIENVVDHHIYVMVNETGKPKYLGRTNDPSATEFVWNSSAPYIAGQYKNGPQNGNYYRFFIYFIREGARPVGPISTFGPVQYFVGESDEIPVIPQNTVIVTDSIDDFDDLSGSFDIDDPSQRELVIRWNLDFENVIDYHVYAIVNDDQKAHFLGRTGGDVDFYSWSEESRFVSGQFKEGPQAGNSYRFMVFVIRKGGPVSGPFSTSGAVDYDVQVDPGLGTIVCFDFSDMSTDQSDLVEVDAGDIQIVSALLNDEDETPMPMSVDECTDEGDIGIYIPAYLEDMLLPASILINPAICVDEAPSAAIVKLVAHSGAVLMSEIDSVVVEASAEVQEVLIEISGDNTGIDILGGDVCIIEVCVVCPDGVPEPEPEPGEIPLGSVIVTDDLLSYEDLSNNLDVDAEGEGELVVRWNLNEPNAKDFHVYAMVNETGRPKYVGRTGSGALNFFSFSADTPILAGNFKDGPQHGTMYRFMIFVIREGQPVLGPLSTNGPVLYREGDDNGEDFIIPPGQVIVTSSVGSNVDLSNSEYVDVDGNGELVVQWNLDVPRARDYHVYAIVNNEGRAKYVGRTGSNSTVFVWNQDTRFLAGPFKGGPQPGNEYTFMVYAIQQGPPAGPFSAEGSVLYSSGE